MTTDLLLHSVSYAGLWGQATLTVDAFVDKAAELGYTGVMLMAKRPHVSVLDYHAARRRELRQRIEAAGLRSVCIAGYTNFTADLEHSEVPHREIQTCYVLELARLAHDLGASLVRIYTGYESSSAGFLSQWNTVVSSLQECCRSVSGLGVTIGVQNHHDLGVGYESMFDLIEAVGERNCRAMFDAWAPALQGADLHAAARHMAPVTAHTTVADYQMRPRFRYNASVVNYEPLTPYVQAVPMGEGCIRYDEFFRGLQAGGFRGSAAYEMCSPLLGGGSLENLDLYAKKFLEYMRPLAAGAA
jgi:sugar phosphate isomerase/epimerase